MKWTLRISSGYNDGVKAKVNPKEKRTYEGDFKEVVKKIEKEFFTEGDEVEVDPFDILTGWTRVWTLIRKLNYGEYRAILRLRPYDEVLDEDE